MATKALGNENVLPPGAALLPASLLDQVGGGNAYYDLFFWVGQKLGAAGRYYKELTEKNCGVELTP